MNSSYASKIGKIDINLYRFYTKFPTALVPIILLCHHIKTGINQLTYYDDFPQLANVVQKCMAGY